MDIVPHKRSLYALTAEFISLLESEEVDGEMLEKIGGEIAVKVENICRVRVMNASQIAAAKGEIDRLKALVKVSEAKDERLKDYLVNCLQASDIKQMTAGTFRLTVADNPPALEVYEVEAVPDVYFSRDEVVITRGVLRPVRTMDKSRLKSDLLAGKAVTGAHITRGVSLRIK
jgi:hypothetical protein